MLNVLIPKWGPINNVSRLLTFLKVIKISVWLVHVVLCIQMSRSKYLVASYRGRPLNEMLLVWQANGSYNIAQAMEYYQVSGFKGNVDCGLKRLKWLRGSMWTEVKHLPGGETRSCWGQRSDRRPVEPANIIIEVRRVRSGPRPRTWDPSHILIYSHHWRPPLSTYRPPAASV